MFATSKSAIERVESKGLRQISNETEIEKMVEKIINENEEQKHQYLNGNNKILGWFVGQVMKKTKGKANPSIVNSIIIKKLKE